MLVLGAVARDDAWLDALELTARERARRRAPCAPRASPPRRRAAPSELVARLARAPGRGGRGRRRARGLATPRGAGSRSCATCSCEIGGDDLIAAGVPEGPEIGRRLERTLAAQARRRARRRARGGARDAPSGAERDAARRRSAHASAAFSERGDGDLRVSARGERAAQVECSRAQPARCARRERRSPSPTQVHGAEVVAIGAPVGRLRVGGSRGRRRRHGADRTSRWRFTSPTACRSRSAGAGARRDAPRRLARARRRR